MMDRRVGRDGDISEFTASEETIPPRGEGIVMILGIWDRTF